MKKHFLVCCLMGYFFLNLLNGCASQIAKGTRWLPGQALETIIPKMKAQGNPEDEINAPRVGVVVAIINYLNELGVDEGKTYEMVSRKIMAQFNKSGVDARLIYNQNDPGLENIDYLICVEFRGAGMVPGRAIGSAEDIARVAMFGVVGALTLPAFNRGPHYRPGSIESYCVTTHDPRTSYGSLYCYDDPQTMVDALKEELRKRPKKIVE